MKRNIILVLFILNALFGLIGVVWSLLITETICSLLAMFIVLYMLRHKLTVDTQALVEE